MPIVLIVILGLALGGVFSSDGFSIGQIKIAVVDEVAESEITAADAQLGGYPGASYAEMSLYTVLDSDDVAAFLSYETMEADDAESALLAGEIDAVVTVPSGSALGLADAMSGSNGSIELGVTGAQGGTIELTVVKSIVASYAEALSSISADIAVLGETLQDAVPVDIAAVDFAAYIQNAVSISTADVLSTESKGIEKRKVLNSFGYYSIAITCMFVLYSAGQGSTFLYTESEEKTLSRLTVAGVPRSKLLIGKSGRSILSMHYSTNCAVCFFNVCVQY